MMPLGPETQLILQTARPRIPTEKLEQIKNLLANPIQWEQLFQLAVAQGTQPLLCFHLLESCKDLLPPAALLVCQQRLREIQKRTLQQTGELIRILTEMKRASIPAIPFRGPALAQLLFGDPSLRLCADLDILIPRNKIEQSRQLLAAMGYHRDFYGTPRQEALYQKWQCEDHHANEEGSLLVELHWGILPRHYHFTLPFEKLWDNLQSFELLGYHCQTLSLTNYLEILCAHGAKHNWAPLRLVADLSALVSQNPNWDWETVELEAKEAGNFKSLQMGLRLVELLFDTSPAPDLPSHWTSKSLSSPIQKRLRETPFSYFPGATETLYDRLVSSDNLWKGILGIFQYVFISTIPDWEWVRLPDRFHFFYYLLRPCRLLKASWRNQH
jgi:hypothetical protein